MNTSIVFDAQTEVGLENLQKGYNHDNGDGFADLPTEELLENAWLLTGMIIVIALCAISMQLIWALLY